MVNLLRETAEEIAEFFVILRVVAQSLYEIRPENVPLEHWFELKPEEKHRTRRMTPKHDQIVGDKIDKMLKPGVVKPASSAWPFPAVIE